MNALQQAYESYVADLWVRRTRILTWIALLAIPTGVVLDYYIYPKQFGTFVFLRIGVDLLLAGLLWLLHSNLAKNRYKLLGFVWLALPTGHLATMIALSDGIMSPYYIGKVLVVMGACLLMPWTFIECLTACGITWLFYAGACLFNWYSVGRGPEFRDAVAVNNAFFMLIFPAIGLASSQVAEGSRSREFKLRFDLDQQRAELEKSKQQLEEQDKAKTQFFSNISHELRTPLTLILSPLDQLRANLPAGSDARARETLDIMYNNALRLLALINDLLDIVKLEKTQLLIDLQPMNLSDWMPGLVASTQGLAERSRLSLQAEFAEGTPLYVLADKDHLEKVFLNLLFNAIKFTPSGGSIRIRCSRSGGHAVVEVSDTGIGIAEEKLGKVFERFWQADASSTRTRQGTGIGLSLAKELVEQHGGSIGVKSQVGVGSTFTVLLPETKLPVATNPSDARPKDWLGQVFREAQLRREVFPGGEVQGKRELDRARRTLLLVEDEPAMQRFLEIELDPTYNVITAVDGAIGHELALKHLPDLIVTDMMLPKMDGITLCRKLRECSELQSTKIVLLTARADDRTKLQALEAGADDFLTKPFSTIELKTRLTNLALSSQLQRDLQSKNQALDQALTELRNAEAQLIQTERLSALGSLSAGIMHEINNPVNFMLTAVNYLRRQIPENSAEAKETIQDLESGLKRVRDIIADLKGFAYGGSGETKKLCELEKVVRTAKRLLSHELSSAITFEEQIEPGLRIDGNENQLVQLLVNLLQNAIQATLNNPARQKPRLVSVRTQTEEGRVTITVRDNGTGITKEVLPKIFDPFFTTKEPGQGLGLGLSISHTIVKKHDGSIVAKSEPGEFTEMLVSIPTRNHEQPG